MQLHLSSLFLIVFSRLQGMGVYSPITIREYIIGSIVNDKASVHITDRIGIAFSRTMTSPCSWR